MSDCGGCQNLGKHSPGCRTQPGAIWYQLAQRAESIGDTVGGNDPGLANRAWALAQDLRGKWRSEQEAS